MRLKRRPEYWERLQSKARISLPLYPGEVYDSDIIAVLKAIVLITVKKGIAPDIDRLRSYKRCDIDAIRRYVEDLFALEYIEPVPGDGWAATRKGFEIAGYEYMKPVLPTNVMLRTRAIVEARRIAHMLKDPAVAAQFQRKYGMDVAILGDEIETQEVEESENS